MHCSISSELPEVPVVSKKSGLLFEKRLIERFISMRIDVFTDRGKFPVTEEPLTVDDIVPIKTGKYDAACRVIARLEKERDDSRALLAQAEKRIPMSVEVPDTVNAVSINNGKRASHGDELGPNAKRICPGISSKIISELANCNTLLSQQRKKRQIPSTLAPAEVVERYTQITVNPLHKTNKPGILSLDIHISKAVIAVLPLSWLRLLFLQFDLVEFDHRGSYLALGGSDTRVYQVVNIKSEWNCIKTVLDLSGTGKATCVKFGLDAKYIAVGSMDRNLRIFGLPVEDGLPEC